MLAAAFQESRALRGNVFKDSTVFWFPRSMPRKSITQVEEQNKAIFMHEKTQKIKFTVYGLFLKNNLTIN